MLVVAIVLAGCGGPQIIDQTEITAVPTATVLIPQPTAPVGATTGAACESGTLQVRDLPDIEAGWRAGVAKARARAINWQADAVLIELQVSCELFESGFRWQATFFSRNAQAYYTADTSEVSPVNLDPDSIIPLPERDVNFNELFRILTDADELMTTENEEIGSLDVRVSTTANPIGPAGVPIGAAIYHVSLLSRGETLELYVDGVQGDIHQFQ